MKKLIVCLLGFSLNALAADSICYAPSPNLVALGDDYYALDREIKLNAASEAKLRTILAQLAGKWHGSLVEISCTGPNAAPKRTSKKLKTNAQLSVNSKGELIVKARNVGYAGNVEKGETLHLFGRDTMYDYVYENNTVKTSEKIRLSSSTTSRLLETITLLNFNNETIELSVSFYSNGVYVQTLAFSLSKASN